MCAADVHLSEGGPDIIHPSEEYWWPRFCAILLFDNHASEGRSVRLLGIAPIGTRRTAGYESADTIDLVSLMSRPDGMI